MAAKKRAKTVKTTRTTKSVKSAATMRGGRSKRATQRESAPSKRAPNKAATRHAHEAFLLEVTSLPTAAGREERVIAFIEQWVAARADRMVLSRDRIGNLTIARHDFLEACAKGVKPMLITAHLDHPAFVVTGLRVVGKGKSAGVELDLEFRGGVNDPYFVGSTLEVFDRAGTHSCEARILSLDAKVDPATKPFKTVVARLARPADAAIVVTGSIARWKFPKAEVKHGLAHTHACDDLAALAAALIAFDTISCDAACAHVALLFTRSEEIGFIGAIGAAREGTVPQGARLLCLENSRSFPHDSPIGGGPIVRVGDRLSVFTPDLTNRVGDLAAAHAKANAHFKYQRKLMPGGACEATAFASFGLASTCICLPLGNYHNMQDIDGVAAKKVKARVGREFISTNDFHWLVEFLEVVARKIDDPSAAQPHRALMDTLWSRHARVVEANVRGA